MKTRGMVAIGLSVAAMTQVTSAFAQGNTGNVNAPPVAGTRAPAADQPVVRGPIPTPTLSFEAGAGILGYTGGTAAVGPAWNARVGFNFTDRWAAEATYTGSVNRRPILDTRLVYTSVDGAARFNVLRADQAPIQPFVAAGLGWVGYAGRDGTGAALVIPLSIGAERLLTERIKIGARLSFRPALGDNLGPPGDRASAGGDTWNLLVNLGGQF